MRRPSFGQTDFFGTALAATAVGLFSFAGASFGAAIVGETRYQAVEQKASALDAR